jgi:hypothetical protein
MRHAPTKFSPTRAAGVVRAPTSRMPDLARSPRPSGTTAATTTIQIVAMTRRTAEMVAGKQRPTFARRTAWPKLPSGSVSRVAAGPSAIPRTIVRNRRPPIAASGSRPTNPAEPPRRPRRNRLLRLHRRRHGRVACRRARFRLLPAERPRAEQHRRPPRVRAPLARGRRRAPRRTRCRRCGVGWHLPAWHLAIHRTWKRQVRRGELMMHHRARRVMRRQRMRPRGALSRVRMVAPRAPAGQLRHRRRTRRPDRGISRGGALRLIRRTRRAMVRRRTLIALAAEARPGPQITERRARLTVSRAALRQRRLGISRRRPARVVAPCDQAPRRPLSGPPVAGRRPMVQRDRDAVPPRRRRARPQTKRIGRRAPRRPQRSREPAQGQRHQRTGWRPLRTPEDRRQGRQGMPCRDAAVPVRRRRRVVRPDRRRRLRPHR